MVSRVRWRDIREFLADMPSTHCTSKPDHSFCTVCMRINYIIAHDCPLYHQKPKRKPRRSHIPDEDRHEAVKDHLTSDDVKHAMKGEDFPIIEFAKPRILEEHEEEEIFDVEPIDVRPLEGIPPKPKRKSVRVPSPRTDEEEPAAPEVDAGTREPPPSIPDPEMVVKEIMDEFTFPTEDDEEEEEPEGDGPEGEDAPEQGDDEAWVEDEKGDGTPEGPDVEEGEQSTQPPRVEKQAVRKRIPRTDPADPD